MKPKKTRKVWVWACHIIGVPLALGGMALAAPGIVVSLLGMWISDRKISSPLYPVRDEDHEPCKCSHCGYALTDCPECSECPLTLEECK